MADKNMTYFDRWAVTRQAGFLMVFLLNAFRAFIVVIFVQTLYQMKVRNLEFQLNVYQIVIALAISLLIWFGNEFFYQHHLKKQ